MFVELDKLYPFIQHMAAGHMDKTSVEKELKALIGGKLKRICQEQSLTLENMADQTGLDYTSFYRIYSGANLPKLITLLQISKTYAIPMEYWFKDIENFDAVRKNKIKQKMADLDLMQVFQKLDGSARKIIVQMLKSYVEKNKRRSK
jgi:transcriptional regulator with XRE-family HTH domain